MENQLPILNNINDSLQTLQQYCRYYHLNDKGNSIQLRKRINEFNLLSTDEKTNKLINIYNTSTNYNRISEYNNINIDILFELDESYFNVEISKISEKLLNDIKKLLDKCKIIKKGHRICIHGICNVSASCNYENEKIRLYCGEHKLPNMINVMSRKCNKDGCKIIACFNFENEPKGIYCDEHKDPGMVEVHTMKCLKPGCRIRPTFNFENETRGIYCDEHKSDNMIDVTSKLCITIGCRVRSSFNYIGETIYLYCEIHKLPNMVCLSKRLCNKIGCNIAPSFNYKNESKAIYCVEHKEPEMVDVVSQLCISEGCGAHASCNYEGNTKRLYCGEHKLPNMIDVANKRCKTTLCNTTISNPNYEGYCFRCFIYTFPDNKIVRNYKTKERTMVDYVLEKFPNYEWILDKIIDNGSSKRRPDMLLNLEDKVIIIECDEDSHKKYDCSCENKRIMEISQDLKHKPIIFIRFNPDAYTNKDNVKIKSCFTVNKLGVCVVDNKKKKEWNERLSNLENNIQYWIENYSNKMIETIELYFDEN